MSIKLTSITDLDTAVVQGCADELGQFLQDTYPNIDIKRGVLNDIVLRVWAMFYAKTVQEIDRYLSARSMLAVQTDPTLADDGVVEHIMSNYNVTRFAGAYATGNITLEFLKNNSVVVPMNAQFTVNGVVYNTTTDYTFSPSTTDPDVASYRLTPLTNGNYGATVRVTSQTAGSAGNVPRGVSLTPITAFADLVKVYSVQDFTGGEDVETNDIMMQRLASGMATPTWGNRDNIEHLLRADSTLESLVAVSTIGCGDPELQRDEHTLFPVSKGGKADIYLKTASSVTSETVTVTATLLEVNGINAIWYIDMDTTVLPGAYAISHVQSLNAPQSDSSYTILTQEVTSTKPGLEDGEAFFSAYQRFVATFETDDESYTYYAMEPTTKQFAVTLIGLTNIQEATDRINRRDLQPVCCDALVRAAIPCFVYIDLILKQSSTTPDETQQQAIKSAIISYINNTGFIGSLSTSMIVPEIQGLLLPTQDIYRMHVSSTILGPNGKMYRQSDCQTLDIPDDPLNHVSSRTVVFFTDVDSITIRYAT